LTSKEGGKRKKARFSKKSKKEGRKAIYNLYSGHAGRKEKKILCATLT